MSDTNWLRPRWTPWLPLIIRKCPRCNCLKFRAAELRPVDELLGLFGLRPVRGLFCWRRFYWISLRGAPAG